MIISKSPIPPCNYDTVSVGGDEKFSLLPVRQVFWRGGIEYQGCHSLPAYGRSTDGIQTHKQESGKNQLIFLLGPHQVGDDI